MTDCSTTMTVVPCRGCAGRSPTSCSTTTGARPSDSSSIITQPRPRQERHAQRRASAAGRPTGWRPGRRAARAAPGRCRAPPRCARPRSFWSRRSIQPAVAQVLGDGQRRERRPAAGHEHDAPGRDLVGGGVGDVAAVEDDRALVGRDQAGDRLEQRRLAGAVGAEQRHDLALVDLEVDVEQHLHVAVADVEAPDEQQLGLALRGAGAAPRCGPRPPSTPGRCRGDQVAGRGDDQAADQEHRRHQRHAPAHAPRVRRPIATSGSVSMPGEHEHRRHREAHRPGPGRDRERQRGEHARQHERQAGADHDVGRHRQPHARRPGEDEHGHR